MNIKQQLAQAGFDKRVHPEFHYNQWRKNVDVYFDMFFEMVEGTFVNRVSNNMHSGSVAHVFEIAYDFDQVPYQFRGNARAYWMGRFNKICLDNDYIVSLYWSNGDPFKDPIRLDNKLRVHIAIMF